MTRLRVVRLMPVLDFGGVESRIVTLAQLVDRDRVDFRVCTFDGHGAAAKRVEALGVPVDTLRISASVRNPGAPLALARYLRETRPQVVHASILEANVQACLVRRLPDAPSVLIEEVGVPRRSLKSRLAFGALYRQADLVVGVSQATCDYLVREHFLPQHQVKLIYNTMHPRFFAPVEAPPDGETFTFLAVGRLVEVKNQALLIRAFADAHRVNAALRLIVAGEGPLRASLEQVASDAGVSGVVTFLGFRDDVLPLLRACDAYVLPSHSEGTSIALMEAMAAGRPFVASTAAGIAEAMQGYDPAWAVTADDRQGWTSALLRMASLPREARLRLGAEARMLVERRASPDAYRKTLLETWTELAQRFERRSSSLASRVRRWTGISISPSGGDVRQAP